jgi:hypothetical protein
MVRNGDRNPAERPRRKREKKKSDWISYDKRLSLTFESDGTSYSSTFWLSSFQPLSKREKIENTERCRTYNDIRP